MSNILHFERYKKRRGKDYFQKEFDIFPKKIVICLEDYKKERIHRITGKIYDFYSEMLQEAYASILTSENFLLAIEDKYGPKILKKTWKSLSKHEKEGLKEGFENLKRRTENIERKVIIHPPYKKEDNKPS